MRKKMIAALTTAGLVAGAGTTAAIALTPGLAMAQEDGVEAPQPIGAEHRSGGVLAGLVDEGVLSADEVVAVQDALRALHEAARGERGDLDRPGGWHPGRAGFRLHGLLDDGVVDADEIAGLPDDSPILDPESRFAPYLEDGELSAADLEELAAMREAEMAERRSEREAAVNSALEALVDDGILTTAQVDAIVEAMATARSEAPRPVRHGIRAGWEIAEMLEDGVIDAAELAELPAGHPLNDPDGPAAAYLDDGRLTEDELSEMRSQLRNRAESLDGDDA